MTREPAENAAERQIGANTGVSGSSAHRVERADGGIRADGIWCNFSLDTIEFEIARARDSLERLEAALDFLRAEQDEELARKLVDAWNGASWDGLTAPGKVVWLNVARVAREHFGGGQ